MLIHINEFSFKCKNIVIVTTDSEFLISDIMLKQIFTLFFFNRISSIGQWCYLDLNNEFAVPVNNISHIVYYCCFSFEVFVTSKMDKWPCLCAQQGIVHKCPCWNSSFVMLYQNNFWSIIFFIILALFCY